MNGLHTTGGGHATGPGDAMGWTLIALAVALLGAAGSLWLSLAMGLRACPLCLYQRTFVLAVVGVLAIGLFTQLRRSNLPNALALPAAVGGGGVAVFHVYLEGTGRLECPAGLLALGTSPQQSLGVFTLLLVALAGPWIAERRPSGLAVPAMGLVLGVLFAVAALQSAPPMPPAPQEPYEQPMQMCRPPYRPPAAEHGTP